MVGLLDLVGNGGCEAALAQRLALLLESGELPDLAQLQTELVARPAECPQVSVVLPSLASYDHLLQEIARLDRFDLLILDDLSYVRRDQAETSVLFELIAERYEPKKLGWRGKIPFLLRQAQHERNFFRSPNG